MTSTKQKRTPPWRILFALLALTALIGPLLQHAKAAPQTHRVALTGSPLSMVVDERVEHGFVLCLDSSGASPRGQLDVVDMRSGQLLRTISLGSNPADMAVDEDSGRLFVTDLLDNTVSLIDTHNGDLLKTIQVGPMQPHSAGRIAIDSRTNRVFVAANPIRVLDARTGRLVRTIPGSGDLLAVAEATGRVFITDDARDSIVVLDARDGTVLQTIRSGHIPTDIAVSVGTGRVFVETATDLLMLDARTARPLRTLSIGTDPSAPFVVGISSERVLLGDSGGAARLLDTRDGSHAGTIALTASTISPVLDDQTMRIFTIDTTPWGAGTSNTRYGGIGVFDAYTGIRVRTTTLAMRPVDITMGAEGRYVYVAGADQATGAGVVSVLDGYSGTLWQNLDACVNPRKVIAEKYTNRVTILCVGGQWYPRDPWTWMPPWVRQKLLFVPQGPPLARTESSTASIIDIKH